MAREESPKIEESSSYLPSPRTGSLESSRSGIKELVPDSTTWREPSEPADLTAPVEIPSKESMTVKLSPSNLVERIDEYQSDENLAHTVIGLLVGTIIGIISDWLIEEPLKISDASLVLAIACVVFTIFAVIWLYRIRKRKKSVKRKLEE